MIVIVRKEEPQDIFAITRINKEAFAGEGEAHYQPEFDGV